MNDPETPTHEPDPNPFLIKRSKSPSPYVKVSVFIGIFLLRILDGIPWVWGNLNVYVTSYYFATGDDSSGASTNWLLSIDTFAFNLGLLIGGLIARRIGIRLTLFFAVVGFNGGLILSYFTVQTSTIALCSTLGVLTGFSGGVVENCQLTLIVRWTDHLHGLAASSVPSMNILGAVVINLILTYFINPSNDAPDSTRDDVSVFTQPDLIHRVPYSFLLYGCLSLAMNLMGLLLIRVNRGDGNFVTEIIQKCKYNSCFGRNNDEIARLNTESLVVHYESLYSEGGDRKGSGVEDESMATPEVPTTNNIRDKADNGHAHITPKEVLKTRAFYILWIFCSILTYAFFILNTYYKEFGLRYIPDDHFLTLVVMVKCVATPFSAWIAGFSVDKFGFKPTMVFVSSLLCIVASFYSLTAVNRWLYLFATVFYGCALFSLFCATSACCVKLYGESHFSIIYGMVSTLTNVVLLTVPPLAQWIISRYGWIVLFYTAGMLALCQVVLLVVGLPSKPYFKKRQ